MTDNARGAALMVLAMATFAVEDAFLKLSAAAMPIGQILLASGIFGAAVFWVLAARAGQRVISPLALHPAVLWRCAGEVTGTLAYITALASVPLATVSAVLQAMPLAVTLGAALFLGERVGWRRWTAIAVGFLGVLVVLRPWADGWHPAALWVVVTVAALAVRDLASRRVPAAATNLQVSVWGLLSVAGLGLGVMAVTGAVAVPPAAGWLWLAGALVFGTVGYWAITAACRTGEVSVVSPFRYTRLVFAIAIGVLVFAEPVDGGMLAGAVLIVGSGLYALLRQAALSRVTKPR
jgi:drug/metabolite transporter (DMT)-like permease